MLIKGGTGRSSTCYFVWRIVFYVQMNICYLNEKVYSCCIYSWFDILLINLYYDLIYLLACHTMCIWIRRWRDYWELIKIYIYHYIVWLQYVILSCINILKPEQMTTCRRHFRMKIPKRKCLYFYSNLTKVVSFSNWSQISVDSGNGRVLNKKQAIYSCNDDPVYWRIYVSPRRNVLRVHLYFFFQIYLYRI